MRGPARFWARRELGFVAFHSCGEARAAALARPCCRRAWRSGALDLPTSQHPGMTPCCLPAPVWVCSRHLDATPRRLSTRPCCAAWCAGRPAAGMHDAQDGPASSNAWIYSLDWERKSKFLGARRHVVRARQVEDVGGTPLASDADAGDSGGGDTAPLVLPGGTGRSEQHPLAGSGAAGATGPASAASSAAALRKRRGGPGEAAVAYWKAGGGLTHVVLTRAGHMAPRDDPATTRWMLERWLAESVLAAKRAGGGGAPARREGGGGDLAAAVA